jgi:hypothetical protein
MDCPTCHTRNQVFESKKFPTHTRNITQWDGVTTYYCNKCSLHF